MSCFQVCFPYLEGVRSKELRVLFDLIFWWGLGSPLLLPGWSDGLDL